MEALLLMLEAVGIGLVLLWVARGRGAEGALAWRSDPVKPARREN